MKQPQIFLSYAREDITAAVRLCNDLRKHGRTIWFDRDCLLGGENWRNAIQKAIRSSDFFLALLSSSSVNKRGMVQAEIKKALNILDEIPQDKIYLIPVRLTECIPTNTRIEELHWIDLFPVWNDGIEQIIKSTDPDIGVLVGKDSLPPTIDLSGQTFSVLEKFTLVHPSETIRETIDLFKNYALNQNINIRFNDIAPNAIIKVVKNQLMIAIANLLRNAIMYSYKLKEHSSWISIIAREKNNKIEIIFENWGVGISNDERNKIFEHGFRGSEAMKYSKSGLGIGLFATKAICDHNNGAINIESKPVRSMSVAKQSIAPPYVTTITLTFPLYIDEQIK